MTLLVKAYTGIPVISLRLNVRTVALYKGSANARKHNSFSEINEWICAEYRFLAPGVRLTSNVVFPQYYFLLSNSLERHRQLSYRANFRTLIPYLYLLGSLV